MSRTIGIDLGTTNSVVSVIQDGKPIIISYENEKILPSVVGIGPDGKLLIGTPARNQYVLKPEDTIRSIKREMGTAKKVSMGGKEYTPQEISAFILRELKRRAEEHLGEPVERCAITVPAYFSDAQRQATKDAGEIAGMDVARIINEPTAAALAYGLDKEEEQKVLVYDLGGGTFDVSLVEINSGVIEVISTHGNNKLGGDDFDERIVERLLEYFKDEHGIDLAQDRKAMARLTRAAERSKILLSDRPYARIQEEFIASKKGRPINLDYELSRSEFESLIADLIDSTKESVDIVLKDGNIKPNDIDKVLLVGGSTRIPAVRRLITDIFMEAAPSAAVNPDECVALGAAVQGGIIDGEESIEAILVDVTPYSLGIAVLYREYGLSIPDYYSVLIPRNTAIPTSKADVFTTSYDDQDAVDIKVYQGEHAIASQNVLLGEFELGDIPSAPAGVPKIIVTFDYDVNGIVNVSAKNKDTGAEQKIVITNAAERMSEYQKDIAISRADELWDEEDKMELTSIRALIRKTKELIEEIDLENAEGLEDLIDELEDAIDSRDIKTVLQTSEELEDLLYELEI